MHTPLIIIIMMMMIIIHTQHREKLLAEAIARDERLAELESKYGETKRRLEEFRKENGKFFNIQVCDIVVVFFLKCMMVFFWVYDGGLGV